MHFQAQINKIPDKEKLIRLIKARVSSDVMAGFKQETSNNRGEVLVDLYAQKELPISNIKCSPNTRFVATETKNR